MKTFARDADAQEILRRLRTITPESPRRWGKMSAHQMVCHLADACRMAIGETPVRPTSTVAQRTLVKWIALYSPLRWPPGIGTVPEINQEVSGTCPSDFARDLSDAAALLQTIAARRRATWPAHPFFGRMSEAAWLRWAYLHTDHHLRQFGA
jgi:Protein of unknown function (DUF1569)